MLLSVDFEDWHQLVRKRVGARAQEAGAALPRQTEALLELFDELGARATFFVLGITARAYPALVERLAARGHEIACHGDQHEPVYTLAPSRFAADLEAARHTLELLTGRAPAGYRAPAFSITADTPWALEVLAACGFAYDSSMHDSPRIRGRVKPQEQGPRRLELADGALWELPPAVWRAGGVRVPVGGASYWSVLPTRAVLHGVARAGAMPALYLHPHELDPRPLRAQLPASAGLRARMRVRARAIQRNAARRRAPQVLRRIAQRHRLITYGDAHAELRAAHRRAAEPRDGRREGS